MKNSSLLQLVSLLRYSEEKKTRFSIDMDFNAEGPAFNTTGKLTGLNCDGQIQACNSVSGLEDAIAQVHAKVKANAQAQLAKAAEGLALLEFEAITVTPAGGADWGTAVQVTSAGAYPKGPSFTSPEVEASVRAAEQLSDAEYTTALAGEFVQAMKAPDLKKEPAANIKFNKYRSDKHG